MSLTVSVVLQTKTNLKGEWILDFYPMAPNRLQTKSSVASRVMQCDNFVTQITEILKRTVEGTLVAHWWWSIYVTATPPALFLPGLSSLSGFMDPIKAKNNYIHWCTCKSQEVFIKWATLKNNSKVMDALYGKIISTAYIHRTFC